MVRIQRSHCHGLGLIPVRELRSREPCGVAIKKKKNSQDMETNSVSIDGWIKQMSHTHTPAYVHTCTKIQPGRRKSCHLQQHG